MQKAKQCDECAHHFSKGEGNSPLCDKRRKPRFFMPKHGGDYEYGYKRKCEDFKMSPERDT